MELVNLHIYPSYFTNESRILREAKTLIKLDLATKIILLGLWKPGLETHQAIGSHIEIRRLKGLRKSEKLKILNLLSFFVFYIQCMLYALRAQPRIVNAHSLTVLPLGVILRLLFRSKLIYDAHELETESNDSQGIRKKIARNMERFFIRFVDQTIVVSHSIKNWYQQEYRLEKIEVIKNIPEGNRRRTKSDFIRRELKLPDLAKIFVYVGTFVPGRGLDMMLRAFKNRDDMKHMVFLGYGPLESVIKAETRHPNIHFLPAVAPGDVIECISSADVGISFIENTCLSYYYCLPNKVFEYIAAGIPFISSAFPELMREFQDHDVAWFSDSESSLTELIHSLTPEEIDRKTGNVIAKQSQWSWEREGGKLEPIFKQLKN